VKLIVVLWRWKEGTEYAGTHFWAVHDCGNKGRPEAWEGAEPLGAVEVGPIEEGVGLELLPLCGATIAVGLARP
jgi:hypothetical protein